MRKLLLSFLLLAATTAGAQVFSTGFENWNDTVPADWMGSKTTLNADSVMQVSTNVHGGTYAVRLQNSSTGSHKRFTTQPVAVTTGSVYTINFWVRGNGQIRTGLYDARAASSGYSSYNSYYTSSANTWTEVTQQITCANTFANGEFILSVLATSGPEHLVVDDLTISTIEPQDASIYEIQNTTSPDGSSTLNGQVVLTGGIVTGVDTIGANSYFIQAGTGPWSGIYVFDATSVVAIGDSVTLQASVTEFQGLTELTSVTNLVVVGQYPVPAAEVLTPNQAQEEQWEGVLATVNDIGCTAAPDANNQWLGQSTTAGSILVDDLMFLYVPTVGDFYSITGVLTWTFNERKIEPRFLADIAVGSGIGEQLIGSFGMYPNPASDLVRMDFELNGQRAEYSVVDASGRTVSAGTLLNNTLNVDQLVNGLYTVLVRMSNGTRQARLLVQH